MIRKPQPTGVWLDKYIAKVPDDGLLEGFKRQTQETLALLSTLTEEQISYRYAPGKWDLREMLIHLIDTERLFSFRALCFARGEKQPLPGFDENEYVKNSHVAHREWKSLLEEYIVVRTSTVAMFAGFVPEIMNNSGVANSVSMSVASLGFATIGHEMHHLQVMQERYLSAVNSKLMN